MLSGAVLLATRIIKCFQQHQHVSDGETAPVALEPAQQSSMTAAASSGEAVAMQMDVDEEWTAEEETFMRAAIEQARVALHRREVPVGCVIVRDGRIIAKGFNLTNELRNATRHAEFQAIDEVLRQSGGDLAAAEFRRCQLYVTCEPCIMCAGALSLVGMGRVYFGCPNDKFGGCGSILAINEQGCGQCGRDSGARTYHGPPLPPNGGGFERRGGLFAEAAVQLLQDFYLAGNPKAPKPARPVVDVPPWELELEQQRQQQQQQCAAAEQLPLGGGGGEPRRQQNGEQRREQPQQQQNGQRQPQQPQPQPQQQSQQPQPPQQRELQTA
ncbi:MAG: cytidine deaminase-like protein [Monoraphidium minutum]|nr:MAG: cytidine deaminase-like protein [Monoraphidium minutum]